MQKTISITVENNNDKDVVIHLFDSREWNSPKKLNVKNNNHNISYDDILHNLIKNDIVVDKVLIMGYLGEGLNYCSNKDENYDYKLNPLNTIIMCLGFDVYGTYFSTPIGIKAKATQHQKTMVASDVSKFTIGNLSYLEYTSKAKTTVDIVLFVGSDVSTSNGS